VIEKVARFGYAAKGAVYLLLGYLSCYAAWSGRKPPSGSKGAMAYLLVAPFGEVILGMVAAGLFAYVLWRLIQAFLDPENKGRDAKGLWLRVFYFSIACAYSSVAIAALRLLTDHRATRDAGLAPIVAKVMDLPFGSFGVLALAVGLLVFAALQLKQGITSGFVQKLNLSRIPSQWTPAAIWSGRIGLSARGIAFGTMAVLMSRAAMHHNPGEAKGLGGALRTFQLQPWGEAALGGIGVGLAVYGIYSFVLAACRRIDAR
jgi:hypothetical protein